MTVTQSTQNQFQAPVDASSASINEKTVSETHAQDTDRLQEPMDAFAHLSLDGDAQPAPNHSDPKPAHSLIEDLQHLASEIANSPSLHQILDRATSGQYGVDGAGVVQEMERFLQGIKNASSRGGGGKRGHHGRFGGVGKGHHFEGSRSHHHGHGYRGGPPRDFFSFGEGDESETGGKDGDGGGRQRRHGKHGGRRGHGHHFGPPPPAEGPPCFFGFASPNPYSFRPHGPAPPGPRPPAFGGGELPPHPHHRGARGHHGPPPTSFGGGHHLGGHHGGPPPTHSFDCDGEHVGGHRFGGGRHHGRHHHAPSTSAPAASEQ